MNIPNQNLLESFMKEHFPFKEMKQIGFFTKEMKGDYEAQAKRVCDYFGYDTVYEYGSKEISCHLTLSTRNPYVDQNGELKQEPFVSVIPSIYEDKKNDCKKR